MRVLLVLLVCIMMAGTAHAMPKRGCGCSCPSDCECVDDYNPPGCLCGFTTLESKMSARGLTMVGDGAALESTILTSARVDVCMTDADTGLPVTFVDSLKQLGITFVPSEAASDGGEEPSGALAGEDKSGEAASSASPSELAAPAGL